MAKKKKAGRKRLDSKGVTDRDGFSPRQLLIKERWRKALKLKPAISSKALNRAILDASDATSLQSLELVRKRG